MLAAVFVPEKAADLADAQGIIVPGVGHFGQMMRALDSLGVRETLLDRIHAQSSTEDAIRAALTEQDPE